MGTSTPGLDDITQDSIEGEAFDEIRASQVEPSPSGRG
jgi:hypothetical protein